MNSHPLNTIIEGDSREILKSLPDGKNYVVITDPVWPNSIPGLPGADRPYELFAEVACHFPRLAKRVIIILGCNSDPRFLIGMPAGLPFLRLATLRYVIPSYRGRLLNGFEVAYVFGEWPRSRPGRRVLGGEATHNEPHTSQWKLGAHPCARSPQHMSWLVSTFTDEEDIVLDPFLGSGTTAIACEKHNRNWLGMEIDSGFILQAEERLKLSREQQRLL